MKDYKLGNKLYELRKEKNLTQEDLALLLDISDKSVSKWENGSSKPSITNLKKISSIFDISLDDLIELDDEKKEKKIVKIVLTGGPCAGKTTAMNWIQNNFQKYGYKVLFVPEAATELITSGITPWEMENSISFQSVLMDMQLEKEKLFEEAATKFPCDKILIVCDRGLLDNKAYMTSEEFSEVLSSIGMKEVALRDNYDAVFHLVTAAKGAEKYYTLDNNQARTETPEQAREIDDNLIASWTGHPHLRVIDNSTDFEGKMQRLISEIAAFLGEPEPLEIERKFLIEYPDTAMLEKLANCSRVEIIQTYLKSDNGEEVRVRQRGSGGSFVYYLTRKRSISGVKRFEIERRLTQEEYLSMLMDADTERRQIRKTRYCLSLNNLYYEIDVYPFWKDKAIAEIELSDENTEIVFPDFIKVIKEVTDDPEYKNAMLAKIK